MLENPAQPSPIMEIELHAAISLFPETFRVLVAPVELLAEALNSHLELQRYKILFISGNYSRILSLLDRIFTELEIRCAFTVFQLMTILKENHHSILVVEHDPLLYEGGMPEKWWNTWPRPSSRRPGRPSTALLARTGLPPAEDNGTGRPYVLVLRDAKIIGRAKIDPKMPETQRTLVASHDMTLEARGYADRFRAGDQRPGPEMETAKEILAEIFGALPYMK